MLSLEDAQDRALALVARARRAGADAADAMCHADASESVSVRLGRLEDVSRSESARVSLRVFVGKRNASIGASELSAATLDELADRALAMARAAPEDAYAGLAPEELLARQAPPGLDLVDPTTPTPEALREQALSLEDAARAVPGVTNSEGGGASAGSSLVALATSHGFIGAYAGTHRALGVSVVAGEGAGLQRDYASRSARYGGDLLTPAAIGALAGERAVARLGPTSLASGVMPVVFDPRVGGSLLSPLVSAISGGAITRRASFLLDHRDTQLFDSAIRIIDDPLRVRGLRSRPFDGEGLATAPRDIVAEGRLTGWLMDSAAARQLGAAPTGHAGFGGGITMSNLHLAPGAVSPAALIADIGAGFYVTELIGHGVNGITGDYSLGAAGFRIEHGVVTTPVAEVTIAGNLLTMFRALTPADDLAWEHAINVPTLRIDGMTVAGAG